MANEKVFISNQGGFHTKSMQTSSMTLQTQRVQMGKTAKRAAENGENGEKGVSQEVSYELFPEELCQRNKHKTGSRFLRVRPLKSLTFNRVFILFFLFFFLASLFCCHTFATFFF